MSQQNALYICYNFVTTEFWIWVNFWTLHFSLTLYDHLRGIQYWHWKNFCLLKVSSDEKICQNSHLVKYIYIYIYILSEIVVIVYNQVCIYTMGGLSSRPPVRYCSLWDGQGSTYVPPARICSIPHWGETPLTHAL